MEQIINQVNRNFDKNALIYFRKMRITVTSYERHGIFNYQHFDYLFNRLFRLTSKKISKPVSLALCERNPPVTGGFPSQRASNVKNAACVSCHVFQCVNTLVPDQIADTFRRHLEMHCVLNDIMRESS